MRAVLAIVVGLVAGLVGTIVIGIFAIGAFAGSGDGPARVDMADTRAVIEVFEQLPEGAKLGMMLAWFVGGFAGAAIAKLIERRAFVAWTVAALIGAYVLANVFVLPMPGWMQALSIVAPLLGGLVANHLIASRAPAAAASPIPPADA